MASNVIAFPLQPANDNGSKCPPPAQRAMLAMEALDRLYGRLESRPNRFPGGLRLDDSPANCPHHCDTCYLECAIIPERIAWWEKELAGATASSGIGRV